MTFESEIIEEVGRSLPGAYRTMTDQQAVRRIQEIMSGLAAEEDRAVLYRDIVRRHMLMERWMRCWE